MDNIDIKILVSSVFSFSIALAWNSAVSKAIDYYYPAKDEVTQYFLYAFAITILIIVLLMIINKVSIAGGIMYPMGNIVDIHGKSEISYIENGRQRGGH